VIRLRRVASLVTLLAACTLVHAQDGRVSLASGGTVTFAVSESDLVAAQACDGCVLVAPLPGPAVVLEVRRQNPNRVYTLDVAIDGWIPNGGPGLEAQYTVTSRTGRTVYVTTGWLPVDGSPQALFTQDDVGGEVRARVEVAYRLRLSGDESAGAYTTSAVYRIRESGSSVAHPVVVDLPTFLALRWAGSTGTDATLRFEYADAPSTYVQAVTTGALLPPTSADFDRLEVSTNHLTGYVVTVFVTTLDAPALATELTPQLRLTGQAADGLRFVGDAATEGFITLATPADFGLAVDGREMPGAYRFTLRYEGERGP
jgi:hypothetical protein